MQRSTVVPVLYDKPKLLHVPGSRLWRVMGRHHGAVRTLHVGSMMECVAYLAELRAQRVMV